MVGRQAARQWRRQPECGRSAGRDDDGHRDGGPVGNPVTNHYKDSSSRIPNPGRLGLGVCVFSRRTRSLRFFSSRHGRGRDEQTVLNAVPHAA